MHLLSSSKKFSNKIERWKGGRGNYVRANETRLTVSFTPQLRAKKRKLNSLTAQSPYISRTEAVLRCHSFKRSSPPLPLFYLSIQINFPISTGKIEPNFLIVSRRIDADDVKYEAETFPILAGIFFSIEKRVLFSY